VIAESDLNDPRLVNPLDRGGYAVPAQWSDDFHHALHSLLTGERKGYYGDFGEVAQLARALRDVFVYAGEYSEHRRRRHGRRPEGLSGAHFLAYAQNHDQVGNRARGERLSQLVDVERLKLAAALVLCSPYVPMLFQGEEWGASSPFLFFSDHQDPAVGRSTSEGRMSEFRAFGWSPEEVPDPQAESSFLRSKLDWSELEREPHRSLYEWHRRLIELSRSTPELRDFDRDRLRVEYDEAARRLTLVRGPVSLRCDFASGTVELDQG